MRRWFVSMVVPPPVAVPRKKAVGALPAHALWFGLVCPSKSGMVSAFVYSSIHGVLVLPLSYQHLLSAAACLPVFLPPACIYIRLPSFLPSFFPYIWLKVWKFCSVKRSRGSFSRHSSSVAASKRCRKVCGYTRPVAVCLVGRVASSLLLLPHVDVRERDFLSPRDDGHQCKASLLSFPSPPLPSTPRSLVLSLPTYPPASQSSVVGQGMSAKRSEM